MRFFENSAINRVYAHSVLQSFAEQAAGVFVFIYLLKAGVGVPLVLLTGSLLLLARFVFRRTVVPFALRFGMRSVLVVGTFVTAASYVVLIGVHGLGPMLGVYTVLAAVGEGYYWTGFHATVARFGDDKARGSQTSAIQLIYALNAIAAPLFGGLALMVAGPVVAFSIAAAVQATSCVPLLHVANLTIPVSNTLARKDARFVARIYFGDGLTAAGMTFAWSLALFQTLGSRFDAYGLALGGAGLIGAVMALGIGRLFDLGHRRWAAGLGLAAMLACILLRSTGYGSPFSALIALASGAIAGPLYAAAYNARVYDAAKASGDALRFHVAGEGGWDFGAGLGCAVAAGISAAGLPAFYSIAIGFFGWMTVAFSLLRKP